jgi:DNA polymerase-3 subunit beta
MRLVAAQVDLHRVLQTVTRIVSAQNTLPVLSGVYLVAEDDRLTVQATDMVSRMSASMECAVLEPGELVLPAATLAELIQRIPTAEVRLEAEDDTGQAVVHYGRNRTTLHGFRSGDMPRFPVAAQHTVTRLTLGPGQLARMARQTLFAAARDESRPILKGVLATFGDGKAVLVSTDGTRLSHAWAPVPGLREETLSVILPARALQEASRISGLETVDVEASQSQVTFRVPGAELTTLLLEGRFPDYQRVIPMEFVTEIRVATDAVRGAVERVNLIAHRDRAGSIRLRFQEGQLEVSSQAADVGQAYEVLEVEGHGQPLDLSFNPSLLLDAIKSVDQDDLVIELAGTQMPARVRGGDSSQYFHIVLPLRQLV